MSEVVAVRVYAFEQDCQVNAGEIYGRVRSQVGLSRHEVAIQDGGGESVSSERVTCNEKYPGW